MMQSQGVTITVNPNDKKEYVVRDKNKINIGRFYIYEIDSENKRCNIKFKFYRLNDYDLIKGTINLLLKAVFKDRNINKVNIFVVDTISLSPFLDLGFILEGIFTENIFYNGIYSNEISLGITRMDYNVGERYNFVELESADFIIKLLTPENANELLEYNIRNKDHLAAFEPIRDSNFYTIEAQKNILNDSYRQFLNGSAVDFGIFIEDKLIGKLRLSNIVYGIFKSGILGYSIDKDYQGRGFMKQAVNLVLKYAFDELELHRIEASALVDNEKSKSVLLGCGFEELGLNKNYLFINGSWRDHITYYKIK